MGKLFKVLVILVILAAVTAGGYAFVRGSRNGDSKFKLEEARASQEEILRFAQDDVDSLRMTQWNV